MKILSLLLIPLFLTACGSTTAYIPEPLDATSMKVETEAEANTLESQGYQCRREILAQPEEDCREVQAGTLCSPGNVKEGGWICEPSESPNP